jgi:glycosyltransferase involved in cell wall biosynthesis
MSTQGSRTVIDAADSRVRRMRLLARGLYGCSRIQCQRRSSGGPVRSALHITPCLFGPDGIIGGGERASYSIARAVAREIPTTLVSFGAKRVSQRHGELAIEIYPSAGDLGGQQFDPLSHRFLEQVRDADVVHCHQYRIAVSQLAILAGAVLGKRAFATDRGGVGVHFTPDIAVERCLTALLPISRFSQSLLPDGIPSRVIYGGATEWFLSEGARSPSGGSAGDRRVLFVGRIMRHKGIDVLIRGLPHGIGLDVVGHLYDEEYQTLLRRLAVDRDVRFVHDADDRALLNAYRGALVTVLPSVHRDAFGGWWEMPELLGNVLLESMSCETPVICSDVGGMPEVVVHGRTGFVVPPNDPSALGARIAELAGNPGRRVEMGRRAREHVLDRFTWERAARDTVAAYRAH